MIDLPALNAVMKEMKSRWFGEDVVLSAFRSVDGGLVLQAAKGSRRWRTEISLSTALRMLGREQAIDLIWAKLEELYGETLPAERGSYYPRHARA